MRLNEFADERMAVSVYVACELHAGAELAAAPEAERAKVDRLLDALGVVGPGHAFPRTYAKVLAELRRRGQTISTMDLLIAAAALEQGVPLLTRNARDFDRVPGLVVMGY